MPVERTAVTSAALRFGRDDKGYGGASIQSRCRLSELQMPPLRSGQDDKFSMGTGNSPHSQLIWPEQSRLGYLRFWGELFLVVRRPDRNRRNTYDRRP